MIKYIKRLRKWNVFAHNLRREKGISYPRQFFGVIWTVLYYRLQANDYYSYRFWDPLQKSKRGNYISQATYVKRLCKIYRSLGISPVWCKVEFYKFCKKKNLATVPIIKTFKDGKSQEMEGWRPEYCKRDVYVKPFIGYHGDNIELWHFDQGSYARDGVILSLKEFENHLAERSVFQHLLLEPRLINHSNLKFQISVLCTVRLMTSRGRDGRIECIMPSMRIPNVSAEVDNFVVSGIGAKINMSSGELEGAILRKDGLITEISCHPDTGAQITNTKIPYWEEVRQLCIKAQEACEKEHFVGWDVGITPDGPVLIEGNRVFGLEFPQVVYDRGMHDTSFPQHFREHYPQYF